VGKEVVIKMWRGAEGKLSVGAELRQAGELLEYKDCPECRSSKLVKTIGPGPLLDYDRSQL
jgi:hypothetical protein